MDLSSFQKLEARKIFSAGLTSATMGTTGYISPDLGDIVVVINYLDTETVSVTGTNDLTNASAALKPINAATGQPVAATALGVGTYIFKPNFRHFVFTKSAGTNVGALVAFAEGVPVHGAEVVTGAA